MTSEPTTEFDRTTAIVPSGGAPGVGPNRFEATLDDGWASLRGVHGGYVTAIAVRAAQAVAPDRRVRTVATSFFSPAQLGPLALEVEVLRAGRGLWSGRVICRQGDRTVSEVRVTAVSDTLAGTHDWAPATAVLFPLAPVEECVEFAARTAVRHFERATGRLDPAGLPFTGQEQAWLRGWVRPLEARPIDAPWLAMILDWFPPSPFTKVEAPIGGVSVDYTVHLHRELDGLAEGAWLAGSFRTEVSQAGLALERGVLATAEGLVLAESFHTRWTG